MKFVRLPFLTALIISFPLFAATIGSGPPSAAATRSDLDDLTSLRARAERGIASAQYILGLAYAEGRQTPKDPVEAFAWLTLAAEGGSTGKALDNVLESLTSQQLALARRRLESLRAGNPNLRLASVAATTKAPAAAPTPIISAPVRSAIPSTPVIAVPPSPATTTSETKQLQDQLAAAVQDKRQLSAELATAWKEIEQLQGQLAARARNTAELAAAQTSVREAQATLAKQSAELAASKTEAAGARIELTKLQSQLTTARESLAANSASASTAGNASAALERERTAHAATQSTLNQLKSQVNELTAASATLEREMATRNAAAERAQGNAADEARKLAAQGAEHSAKADTLSRELTQARGELATARQSLTAATAKATTDAETQIRRVTTLEETLSAARNELTQTKAALTAATTNAQSAAARAEAAAQAESQLIALRNQVGTLDRDLQAAKTASNRVAADKATAETALRTAHQKLADSTQELGLLRQRAEEGSRQLSATSDQKVAALQAKLNDANFRLAAAEKATGARNEEVAKLRAAAASTARPAIAPGELEAARRDSSQAQQRLESATQELATLRTQAAAVPALETRVRQLEAERAVIATTRSGDSSISKEEFARVAAAQADAEDKLSTALRSYTLLTKERDELRARVAELSVKHSATTEALTTAEAQAQAASASASASIASSAELEALRIRSAAAERAAETSRAELDRTNQLLAGYRPRPTQPGRQTLEPGRPASTHTIAVGETLSGIALRYYGTATRWPEILAANRDVLPDERSFIAGRTLRIP